GVRRARRAASNSSMRSGVKTTIGRSIPARRNSSPSVTVATPKPQGSSSSRAHATRVAPRPYASAFTIGRRRAPVCSTTRAPFRSNAPRSTSTQARVRRLCIHYDSAQRSGARAERARLHIRSLPSRVAEYRQAEEAMQAKPTLEDTLSLMRDLRQRCEWDAAQTHESLRHYLIEEAYEVDDAIRAGNDRLLREELGDLLLQVLFHSVVAEERGAFDFHDVAETFVTKMKGRHPHLYGDGVRQPWEKMKARKRQSIVDGLPADLPSLHRAFRLQDRAAGVGFDWPDVEGPMEKVREELDEVRTELDAHPDLTKRATTPSYDEHHDRVEDELGDLLFAVVNLCRKAGVHPALALDRANVKFATRFRGVEQLAAERGLKVGSATLEELDKSCHEVKRVESGA